APPPISSAATLQGNRVLWQTDQPTRASVRYSFARGSWDHMAYPDAAGRQDRALVTAHSIALLDLARGRKVFYQTVDQSSAGTVYWPVDSFVAVTDPSRNLLISTMIHIGFGDSHVLTMPTSGKHILIDSGTRAAETSVETYLSSHGITTIDVMYATHTH